MRIAYGKIDAGVIGAPEDVVVDDHEVSRDGVALVKYILVDALQVVDRHRQRRDSAKEAK